MQEFQQHLSPGLSKVAGCRLKSLPSWLASSGHSAKHFFTDGTFDNISLEKEASLKTIMWHAFVGPVKRLWINKCGSSSFSSFCMWCMYADLKDLKMAKQIRNLMPAPDKICYNTLRIFSYLWEKRAWRLLKWHFRAFKFKNFGEEHTFRPLAPYAPSVSMQWL